MRLSNKKKIPIYNFFQILFWMGLVFGIVLFFIEKYKMDFLNSGSYLLILIPLLLLCLFWLRGKQVFEYDSDGETLNFNNYSIVPLFKNQKKDEFPKYKLRNFEVIKFIFIKKILIDVYSKKSHQLTLKYDISYLTNKEVRDLKISLKKVVKANKEENQLPTETL